MAASVVRLVSLRHETGESGALDAAGSGVLASPGRYSGLVNALRTHSS